MQNPPDCVGPWCRQGTGGAEAKEFARGRTALRQHCQSPTPGTVPERQGRGVGAVAGQAGPVAAGQGGRTFHLSLFFPLPRRCEPPARGVNGRTHNRCLEALITGLAAPVPAHLSCPALRAASGSPWPPGLLISSCSDHDRDPEGRLRAVCLPSSSLPLAPRTPRPGVGSLPGNSCCQQYFSKGCEPPTPSPADNGASSCVPGFRGRSPPKKTNPASPEAGVGECPWRERTPSAWLRVGRGERGRPGHPPPPLQRPSTEGVIPRRSLPCHLWLRHARGRAEQLCERPCGPRACG